MATHWQAAYSPRESRAIAKNGKRKRAVFLSGQCQTGHVAQVDEQVDARVFDVSRAGFASWIQHHVTTNIPAAALG